jgi:hypothetical protein
MLDKYTLDSVICAIMTSGLTLPAKPPSLPKLRPLHRLPMRSIAQQIRNGDLSGLSRQKTLKTLISGKLSGTYLFFFLIPDPQFL